MKVQLDSVPQILAEYLDAKVIPQYRGFSKVDQGKCLLFMFAAEAKLNKYVNDPKVRSMFPDGLVDLDESMGIAKKTLKYLDGKVVLPIVDFGITEIELGDIYEIAKKYAVQEEIVNNSNSVVNSQTNSLLNNINK